MGSMIRAGASTRVRNDSRPPGDKRAFYESYLQRHLHTYIYIPALNRFSRKKRWLLFRVVESTYCESSFICASLAVGRKKLSRPHNFICRVRDFFNSHATKFIPMCQLLYDAGGYPWLFSYWFNVREFDRLQDDCDGLVDLFSLLQVWS